MVLDRARGDDNAVPELAVRPPCPAKGVSVRWRTVESPIEHTHPLPLSFPDLLSGSAETAADRHLARVARAAARSILLMGGHPRGFGLVKRRSHPFVRARFVVHIKGSTFLASPSTQPALYFLSSSPFPNHRISKIGSWLQRPR